jgi:hypothetical protein
MQCEINGTQTWAEPENLSTLVDDKQQLISRTSRSPSATATLEATGLEESQPQPSGLVTDPDQEWEIRNIVGRKAIGGEVYYWVDWEPTWMAESKLHNAGELRDGFVAQLQYTVREDCDIHGKGFCSKGGQQKITVLYP